MRVDNKLPIQNAAEGIRLGLVRARGISPGTYPQGFDAALADRLSAEQAEKHPVGFDSEARRQAARDMLRNGSFKPTGRSKPASEYLIRAALSASFPRINSPADINNLISLEERLPISLWDIEKAGVDTVVFRLGRSGESYVFNPSGQEIDVTDLACGCGSQDGGEERPFVNPIKDSLRTRTDATTRHVLAAVYAPANLVDALTLEQLCERFVKWLAGTGTDVETAVAVAGHGKSVTL